MIRRGRLAGRTRELGFNETDVQAITNAIPQNYTEQQFDKVRQDLFSKQAQKEIEGMYKDKVLTSDELRRLNEIKTKGEIDAAKILKELKEKFPDIPWDKLKEAMEKAVREKVKKDIKEKGIRVYE